MSQNIAKVTPKSHTASIFPILVALDAFKEYGIYGFGATSKDQEDLLKLLPAARTVKYSDDQIKSFVSNKVEDLNRILKLNGFDIQLNESQDFELGTVTIMDIMVRWLQKAEHRTFVYENELYDAMEIKSGASIVTTKDEKQVLMIRTREGICVFIELADRERSGLELFNHVFELSNSLTHSETPCDATIPVVKIDEQPDMSWLLGLKGLNSDMAISQALQQNRLEINLDGIHAESATTVGLSKGISIDQRRKAWIEKPFNIWLAYADNDLKYFPLFTAYVSPESWQPRYKKYRLGNQPEEYELVTKYLGWVPEKDLDWDNVFPILSSSSETKGKEVTIVNSRKDSMVTLVIDHRIIKDAFPMSFYGEDRADNWHHFCIVSMKDTPAEKFIIPLH
jgi:hypothetical protein